MSIRRHTLANIAGSIVPMIVMLVTVPLYLKVLGDARYGVLTLVWLMIGYFSFMEMGLGRATANRIALLNDASNQERGDIFWNAILANTVFGTIAALILWLIGSYLISNVLKISSEFRQEAIIALPWVIATLPLALISSVLNGALEGRNKFSVVNSLQVASTIVFQVVPLYIAYVYSPSLAYVIPAAVLSRVIMNIPFLIACFYLVSLKHWPKFSRATIKSLLSYGGWVAVSGIIGPLLETIDRFLIGILLGAQAVTYYTLPYQLISKVRIIPGSLSRALFPKFTSEDSVNSDKLAILSLEALVIVMTPVVVLGVFLLKPFMIIWVGEDIADIASPLGRLFLVGVWISSLSQISYSLLQGKGRPDIVAKLHALEIIPFLFILWLAMDFLGIYGAALAWTIRSVVDALLLFYFSNLLSKKCIHIMFIPFFIIIASIAVTYYISEEGLLLQGKAGLLFFVFILLWLKKQFKTKNWSLNNSF